MQAIKNWHSLKFRISIIATFGQLNSINEDKGEVFEPLPKKKPKYKRPWFIISHESRYRLIWDVIWSIMLLFSYFLTCFTLAFNTFPLNYMWKIEILLDIMQLLDISLNFITTCEGTSGVVERPLEIAYTYMRSTFIFDATGCLPNLIMMEKYPHLYILKVLRYI